MKKTISTRAAREIRKGIEQCQVDVALLGHPILKVFIFSGASGQAIDGYTHTAYNFYSGQLKRYYGGV